MAEKTFEASMRELEEIVAGLEAGDITLDKSLELFENGIKLAKSCRKKLDDAQRRVMILTESDDGGMVEKEFEEEE